MDTMSRTSSRKITRPSRYSESPPSEEETKRQQIQTEQDAVASLMSLADNSQVGSPPNSFAFLPYRYNPTSPAVVFLPPASRYVAPPSTPVYFYPYPSSTSSVQPLGPYTSSAISEARPSSGLQWPASPHIASSSSSQQRWIPRSPMSSALYSPDSRRGSVPASPVHSPASSFASPYSYSASQHPFVASSMTLPPSSLHAYGPSGTDLASPRLQLEGLTLGKRKEPPTTSFSDAPESLNVEYVSVQLAHAISPNDTSSSSATHSSSTSTSSVSSTPPSSTSSSSIVVTMADALPSNLSTSSTSNPSAAHDTEAVSSSASAAAIPAVSPSPAPAAVTETSDTCDASKDNTPQADLGRSPLGEKSTLQSSCSSSKATEMSQPTVAHPVTSTSTCAEYSPASIVLRRSSPSISPPTALVSSSGPMRLEKARVFSMDQAIPLPLLSAIRTFTERNYRIVYRPPRSDSEHSTTS